jgi:hypothetical protein
LTAGAACPDAPRPTPLAAASSPVAFLAAPRK